MPKLINRLGAVQTPWRVWSGEAENGSTNTIEPRTLVPLKTWALLKEDLSKVEEIGVLLDGDDSVDALAEDLSQLKVIAVRFAAFTDGRGYSIGRLVRQRYGYRGELQAVGDVGLDQLLDLWRCGFNFFEIPDTLTEAEIAQAWTAFGESYQADARQDALFVRTYREAA